MVELAKEQRGILAELFKDAHDTTVWSYLQGYIGRGWVNEIEHATCGRIILGDFCFLAGQPTDSEVEEFITFEVWLESELIWIPQNEAWMNAIRKTGLFKEQVRYAFYKDRNQFEYTKLQHYVDQLPTKYRFQRIDKERYNQVLSERWAKDLVSNFSSAEEFLDKGIGMLIMEDNWILAGASSYSYYDGGIEIEIITHENVRRQGLATMVGAKLILECLKEGKYPNWDAANLNSVRVAQKLGYQLDMEYPVFIHEKM